MLCDIKTALIQVKPRLKSCSNWSSSFHSLFEAMISAIHRGQHSFAILENRAQFQSISRGMITLVRSVKSVVFYLRIVGSP